MNHDEKIKQLGLEIQLLMLHLKIPAKREKQAKIEAKAEALVALATELPKLKPDDALSMLNDILKEMEWDHEVQFLTNENAKEYVMNNPAVYHMFALVLSFLSSPLLSEIAVDDIKKNRDHVTEVVKSGKIDQKAALDVMETVRTATLEIAQIIDKYERKSGREGYSPAIEREKAKQAAAKTPPKKKEKVATKTQKSK